MFRSYRVGTLFGIPLKLDISLLIVLPFFTAVIGAQIDQIVELLDGVIGPTIDTDALSGGLLPWILGLAAALGLFVGVFLHELGHSLVAMRYGYEIDSITLWLLGGLAQFTEQPRQWSHEFLIAIAGPVVSVAVGIVCYIGVLLIPESFDSVLFVLGYLAVLNVFLAVFNMIPAFPLDGGRVLRSILTRSSSFTKATERAVRIGKIFAVALGLLGLLTFNIFLVIIAFFIYMAGSAEGRHTVIASVFEDVRVKEVMTPKDRFQTVSPELPLDEFLNTVMNHRHTGYPVVEGNRVVGIVTMSDFKEVSPDERQKKRVADVMTQDLKTISADESAMEAFTELSRQSVGRLLVTNDRNEVIGLLTRTDLIRAFEILQQRKLQPSSEAIQVPLEQQQR